MRKARAYAINQDYDGTRKGDGRLKLATERRIATERPIATERRVASERQGASGQWGVERLREAGFRLTRARRETLAVLFAEGSDHLSAGEILARVERAAPAVGRASVFRALDLFTRLALIRPVYRQGERGPLYARLDDGHHHHVICVSCRLRTHFVDCGLEELTARLEGELGMRIQGHLLEFYALCADCH